MNNFGDFGKVMQLMNAWNTFQQNHPKFPMFLKAVSSRGIKEDTIIEMAVTMPDGEKLETNLKITASDLALFEQFRNLQP
ncbi:MAG: hypothetical protein MJ110_06105 [Lachnospiraceae bacterium]|nr:hypothetical protein [Lachnospiraceae bacterium]